MIGTILLALASSGTGPIDDSAIGRERQIREFVLAVRDASGAHFRDGTGRVPTETELLGAAEGQDSTDSRFTLVRFSRANGVVRSNGTLSYSQNAWPALPIGARRWTAEECETAARRSLAFLLPRDIVVHRTDVQDSGPEVYRVTADLSPAIAPEVRLSRVTLHMDTVIGMPLDAELSKGWPAIERERVVPLVSKEACLTEAERVYWQASPYGQARVLSAGYSYQIPNFAAGLNEMTREHHDLVARNARTAIFTLEVAKVGAPYASQIIAVDALTGKGLACIDTTRIALLVIGSPSIPAPFITDSSTAWTYQTATGRLDRVQGTVTEGDPIVLRGTAGELWLVRFDRKLGLIGDKTGTYRPDAALLKAMRAQGPVRPFGKDRNSTSPIPR